MCRILFLILLLFGSSGFVFGQGAFKPRDANEATAWQIYQQYKASKAKQARLEGAIAQRKKDNAIVSGSIVGGLGIPAADRAELVQWNKELNAEIALQEKLLPLWNRRFRGRYGELSDMQETILDPKTNANMDRIEFRIRYFAFDLKAAEASSANAGPAKIAGGWTRAGENLWSDNPGIEQYISDAAAGMYKIRGTITSGSTVFTWINPNREGAPRTSLAVEWNPPPANITPGSELVISANAIDKGSDAGAGEGDFVSFVVGVFATKDETTWVAVSGGGRELYAFPRKSERREFRFTLPNEQYKKIIVRMNTGSQSWYKYYDYVYEWNGAGGTAADEPRTSLVQPAASGENRKRSEEAIKKGDDLLDGANYSDALKQYAAAVNADDKNSEAYEKRGVAKGFLEDWNGAMADITKAIELDPGNATAYENRGRLNSRFKNWNEAKADYSKVIELEPTSQAYRGRGYVDRQLEDYEAAIADYSKAIDIEPANQQAYLGRGHANLSIGNNKASIADYSKSIELKPTPTAYVQRGKAKERLGDLKGALKDYESAIQIDPNDEEAIELAKKLRSTSRPRS